MDTKLYGTHADMIRVLIQLGFTEEQIANDLKVNQSTISRLLSGKIRSPRLDVACKIQNFFEKHGW